MISTCDPWPYPHNLIFLCFSARNRLTGSINTELRGLSELRVLELEDGTIGGQIPDIFANLSNLEELSLSFQFLTGEIPTSIYSLSNLAVLKLDTNNLDSEISTSIAFLSNLRILHLQTNQIRGTIPDEVGQLLLLGTFFQCFFFLLALKHRVFFDVAAKVDKFIFFFVVVDLVDLL